MLRYPLNQSFLGEFIALISSELVTGTFKRKFCKTNNPQESEDEKPRVVTHKNVEKSLQNLEMKDILQQIKDRQKDAEIEGKNSNHTDPSSTSSVVPVTSITSTTPSSHTMKMLPIGKNSPKTKVCVHCKEVSGIRKMTSYFCLECDVALCNNGAQKRLCFHTWHQRLQREEDHNIVGNLGLSGQRKRKKNQKKKLKKAFQNTAMTQDLLKEQERLFAASAVKVNVDGTVIELIK